MSDHFGLLVLGGGPAGLSAARAYRESGGEGAVAIVGDESRMPYARPLLSKELLRGEASEAELAIEEEDWLADHGVSLICVAPGSPGRRGRRRRDRHRLGVHRL